MKPNEVAQLTGVTVRTLQYYDRIGLLKPSEVAANGYRIYHPSDLATLQQILFFRELDFSLNEIKEIMQNPHYEKSDALRHQKELLIKKRDRLNGLIQLVDKALEGDKIMSFKEFDTTEIDEAKNNYASEVKERWGSTEAYQEYTKKTKDYNNDHWNTITEKGQQIFAQFASLRHLPAESEDVQALVQAWQDHITENYYSCSKEILSGLGMMYDNDERFKENIDKNGVGTAAFLAQAIEIYCK